MDLFTVYLIAMIALTQIIFTVTILIGAYLIKWAFQSFKEVQNA